MYKTQYISYHVEYKTAYVLLFFILFSSGAALGVTHDKAIFELKVYGINIEVFFFSPNCFVLFTLMKPPDPAGKYIFKVNNRNTRARCEYVQS